MRPFWIKGHPGLVVAALALVVVGCGEPEYGAMSASRVALPSPEQPATPPARSPLPGLVIDASESMPDEATKTKDSATAGRKIIYTGHIDLVTEDLREPSK